MLRASLFLKKASPALLRASLARGSHAPAGAWKNSIRLSSTAHSQHAGKDVRGGFILLPIAIAVGLFACFHHQLHIDTYDEKSLKHSYDAATAAEKKEQAAPELVEIDVVEVLGEEPAAAEENVLVVEEEKDTAAASSDEEDQAAAYNPETGEINWDCPCLGGMAHGPCGEEFKAAFSCFVYSEAEPKGIDCIEKFKGMQDCFRQHPEVYAAELRDEEVPIENNAHQEGAATDETIAPATVITEKVVPVTVVEEVVTPSATIVEEKTVPVAVISEEVAPVVVAEENAAPAPVTEEVAATPAAEKDVVPVAEK